MNRLIAWCSLRQMIRRKPETVLEPVGDSPVFPAAPPMAVRGRVRYPERKPSGGRPLENSREARREMHAQIRYYLAEKATPKK